jgi:predicted dehydrogenase
MSVSARYLEPCPNHIAIIGGGRWARVLIETVGSVVPKSTLISIYSVHNADAMSLWVLENNFEQEVCVHSDISKLKTHKIDGAIVVNAARDHALIIEKNIQLGIPVLVEKPVTLSYATTLRLARLAEAKGVFFASAHVFLFARYLNNFSHLVAAQGEVKSIHVNWTDPKSESRHGESKKYDQGLPVFYDWLPHVLSIMTVLTSSTSIKNISTYFYKGGAHVEIEFVLGNVLCYIKLVRNDNVRRRVFEVIADQALKLDFSNEPGTIYNAEYACCGDEKWDVEKRPVAQMLSAFLVQATGGDVDKRLDIDIGLRANRLIDRVASLYNQALLSWLKTRLIPSMLIDTDLEYALKEIILFNGRSSINIDTCIENIKQAFNSKDSDYWDNKISKSNKPFDIIRSIALSKF